MMQLFLCVLYFLGPMKCVSTAKSGSTGESPNPTAGGREGWVQSLFLPAVLKLHNLAEELSNAFFLMSFHSTLNLSKITESTHPAPNILCRNGIYLWFSDA